MTSTMNTIKGKALEGAGFVEEEIAEQFDNKEYEHKGRDLRNEGLKLQGKPEKLTEPGTTGHNKKDNKED